jgi:lysophospholipase L1-like esterase
MLKRSIILSAITLLVVLAVLGCKPKINVVSIGDSWADGWSADLASVISEHGVPVEVWNKGIPGSTASLWAQPGALLDVQALLVGNRDITWVVLSLGGNDLLDGYLLGGLGDQVFDQIEADIRTVIDGLLSVAPYLKISLNGYDFPNFEHCAYCVVMGQTMLGGNTYTQNMLFAQLTYLAERIANDYPQVYATNLLGSLQMADGVPGAPNFALPSPAKYFADDDCIHPSNGGYQVLMEKIYDGFFDPLNGSK